MHVTVVKVVPESGTRESMQLLFSQFFLQDKRKGGGILLVNECEIVSGGLVHVYT